MSQMPRRTRIVRALTEWIELSQHRGRLASVKLTHCGERSERRVNDWQIAWDAQGKCLVRIGDLATTIEEEAKGHAENLAGDAIEETYNMVPYFGTEMAEGGVCNFRCPASRTEDSDGSPISSFTEGATSKGVLHQIMRTFEGLSRAYLDKFDDLMNKAMTFTDTVQKDRLDLMDKNKAMREEVEDAKDRGVERQLAVYRAYEEEKRTTQLISLLQTVAPDILGMALGRPILPQNSTDNLVKMLKNGIRSIDVERLNAICGLLEPPMAMMLLQMKQQVIEEDEAEERKNQQNATQAVGGQIVQGKITDDKAVGAVAKKQNEIIVQPGEPQT